MLQLRKAIIRLDTICNSNCRFCHTRPFLGAHSQGKSRLAHIRSAVEQARTAGCEMIVLSGGEPLISPLFKAAAALIRDMGLSVGVASNGRALALPAGQQLLTHFDIRYLHLSLHGLSPAVHDHLTQSPGSFAQTWQALDYLSTAPRIFCCVSWVLLRPNLHQLPHLGSALARFDVERITAQYPSLKGLHDSNRFLFAPYQEVLPPLVRLLRDSDTHAHPVFFTDLPLCLLPTQRGRCDSMAAQGIVFTSYFNHTDLLVSPQPDERMYPKACMGCRYRLNGCSGRELAYEQTFLDPPFTPTPITTGPCRLSLE